MQIHTLHKKMVYCQCVFCMWVLKLEFCENLDPHILQDNGFSAVCICLYLIKQALSEKAELHTLQEYGFSPVCIAYVFLNWKCWSTHFTRKGFFTCVNFHVSFQIWSLGKCWFAHLTSVFFFSLSACMFITNLLLNEFADVQKRVKQSI